MRKYKNWNSVEDKLPRVGKWVLIRLDGYIFYDEFTKPPKPFIVVAKISKGLSTKDREKMKSMKNPPLVGGWSNNKDNEQELTYHPRWSVYMPEDVHGNNLVPYCWDGCDGMRYFGQEVGHWKELDG